MKHRLPNRPACSPFAKIKKGDEWNEAHTIARGNIVIHVLNRHVISEVIDDDSTKPLMEGDLGLQLHVSPPMKVKFPESPVENL
ncbi:MAG TPA: family 16 glycoside hydrolase [Bryobacteraceae bacterium]|nr:family 16 glycoside hydrolase [Bryobacteraceae bacterium]